MEIYFAAVLITIFFLLVDISAEIKETNRILKEKL